MAQDLGPSRSAVSLLFTQTRKFLALDPLAVYTIQTVCVQLGRLPDGGEKGRFGCLSGYFYWPYSISQACPPS